MPTSLLRPLIAFFLLLLPAVSPAAAPRVIVTIQPVHSLVAGIMEGVGSPELLLPAGASPHSYALRPSQARSLSQADALFLVGENLETFLRKPLLALGGRTRIVPLSEARGVRLLPARSGGIWGEGDGHDHRGGSGEDDDHGGSDLHLWLDPDNARAMADAVAIELGAIFPQYAGRFAENATKMAARLQALDEELRQTLAPVRDVPYIVFHDGYQYFEKHYGLRAAGAITLSPERSPGARRLGEIRRAIQERQVRCVFSEPQFEPKLVETVTEGTKARKGVLDPLGARIPSGPDAYFTLMRELGAGLAGCLAGK